MAAVKISSKVDKVVTAIRKVLQRRRVRPAVMRHLEDSIVENEKLGRLLAR